jgi:hypothetical protein
VQSFIAHREQFYQSRHVETLSGLNPNYESGITDITQALVAQGQAMVDASQMAVGALYRHLLQQASMKAYIDCFHVLMIFVAVVLPAVLLMKGTQQGKAR